MLQFPLVGGCQAEALKIDTVGQARVLHRIAHPVPRSNELVNAGSSRVPLVHTHNNRQQVRDEARLVDFLNVAGAVRVRDVDGDVAAVRGRQPRQQH